MHKKAERLIAQNEIRRAAALYSNIILMEPDDETAYANMGNCYLILGDFKRAEDAFQNALEINPENETALLGIKSIHDPDSIRDIGQVTGDNGQQENVIANVGASRGEAISKGIASAASQPRNEGELTFKQRVQTALKNAGLYTGPIDGKIGPLSQKAIQVFQKERGLEPDGKVGLKTWAILKKYLET